MRSQREKVDRLGVRKEQGEEEGGTGSIRAGKDLLAGDIEKGRDNKGNSRIK